MDLHADDVHVPDDRPGHHAPLRTSPSALPTDPRRRGPRAASAAWRNRITDHGDEDPKVLIPNPANWRTHPREQQRALASAMSEVGWVAQVMVNRTTGHVVDGHLRVELAISRNEPTVPVTYVELSEDEERLVLASLDPLAAMATADTDLLSALLAELTPWGSETPIRSRRGGVILVDQAAEQVPPANILRAHRDRLPGRSER